MAEPQSAGWASEPYGVGGQRGYPAADDTWVEPGWSDDRPTPAQPYPYHPQGEAAATGQIDDRSSSRHYRSRQRARAREARWANNRYAIPYPTDGPKVTFGVLWFTGLIGAVLLGQYADSSAVSAVAVAAIAGPIAMLAGLQTGHAWFPQQGATRSWTAVAAALGALAGMLGPWGVPAGVVLGAVVIMFYVLLYRGHRRTSNELFDVLARSALPAGLGAASLAAIGTVGTGAQVSLILLVSAYEAGDFLVGSGANNAVEGPLAGTVSMGAVAFVLFLIQPAPFDSTTILLFAVVTGVCCPLGQLMASALLPRGNAWAPALRRLDSYLLTAPIWLLLVLQIPALD